LNRQQLNALAKAAKNDTAAAWEIKAYYMPLIEKLQTENWHKMNSETAFEDDCFRKLEYGIRTFDATKGDFDKRAKALIYQSLKEYCGRRGNRRAVLSSLDKEVAGQEGEALPNTFLDSLKDDAVDVEEAAIEEVAKQELLAKYAGNEMDELIISIILEANELLTQSEITRRLAAKTGRTFNSARGVVRSFCSKQQGARAC
jgi:hypothetical protein